MEDRILDILRNNARISAAEIAKRLGLSEDAVSQAIAQYESKKVILGYQAVISPEKTGNDLVQAIIEIRLTPERDTGFDAIARRIYNFPEVKVCYLMSGAYDLHVVVEGKSLHDVASFVARRLAPLEHVSGTATHFILKKYKEFGVIMGESDAEERLAVSP